MNIYLTDSSSPLGQRLATYLEFVGHQVFCDDSIPMISDLAGLDFPKPDVVINLREESAPDQIHRMFETNVHFLHKALLFAHRVGAHSFFQLHDLDETKPPMFITTKSAASCLCAGFSIQYVPFKTYVLNFKDIINHQMFVTK